VTKFEHTTFFVSHAVMPNWNQSLSFPVQIRLPKEHVLQFIVNKLAQNINEAAGHLGLPQLIHQPNYALNKIHSEARI
jgi:hypothetical protein